MSQAIKIKSLSKSFGQIHAVRDVSFDVNRGEVLGFLGPNGAGKSTTMKMITGFLEPTSGTVEVDGHDEAAIDHSIISLLSSKNNKPNCIVANTIKGRGVSFMEDDNNWHYRIPTIDEVKKAKKELGL